MSTLLNLSSSTLIKAVPDQVCSDLNGEIVILNLKSGTYYGLNATGAFVWHLIQEPKTVAQLRAALLDEYEVEPTVCEQDLNALLQELESQNLIEVTDAADSQITK
ncbi:MAG: PqqD family peptide modification chaperone [Cyanobacteria bacterium P01_F01_bin.86]